MQRLLILLAVGACANALAGLPASAQAPEISLTRLDCGTPAAPTAVNQRFSDTYAYGDLKLQFVFSCYLIKHGDEYLLWDTGHAMTTPNVAPKVSLVDLLAQINVKPEQIKYVGISHYHADHTGQVGFVSQGDALDRQGRLGCDQQPETDLRCELRAVRSIGPKVRARSSRCRSTRTCSATAA